jgi:hypothetical protein
VMPVMSALLTNADSATSCERGDGLYHVVGSKSLES